MTVSSLARRARAGVLLALVAAGAASAPAWGAGLDIHADADATDMGLPAYPGAIKKAKKGDDMPGFTFGIWGADFGFKVVAISYFSNDGLEPVAAFYRDALSHYGPVIDCTGNAARSRSKPGSSSDAAPSDRNKSRDKTLTCEDDTVEPGGVLYKAGTKADQRLFRARPQHGGVNFELVRVEDRGSE